jgi:hypothetical protein
MTIRCSEVRDFYLWSLRRAIRVRANESARLKTLPMAQTNTRLYLDSATLSGRVAWLGACR